jgi:hypothetical protein
MKQYRFIAHRLHKNSKKKYYKPSWLTLPAIFTLADIKPGMFNKYVMKRLVSAQHNAMILVKKSYYKIYVKTIDRDAYKAQEQKRKAKIKILKKKLKVLVQTKEVKTFRKLWAQLSKFGGSLPYVKAVPKVVKMQVQPQETGTAKTEFNVMLCDMVIS